MMTETMLNRKVFYAAGLIRIKAAGGFRSAEVAVDEGLARDKVPVYSHSLYFYTGI